MSNITKEQINNINKKCMNDWKLDVEYYLFHNQKTLTKHIKLDDRYYLEFTLRYNYRNQVSLHISKFYHKVGDYFASSEGLGKSKILDETQATRKSVNNLIEFTKILNDEECMRINTETPVIKNSLFIESKDF